MAPEGPMWWTIAHGVHRPSTESHHNKVLSLSILLYEGDSLSLTLVPFTPSFESLFAVKRQQARANSVILFCL